MGSDGGGGESPQLEMFATIQPPSTHLSISRERGAEVFITGYGKVEQLLTVPTAWQIETLWFPTQIQSD